MAGGKSQLRELLEQILIAGVLAFLIITFVVQSFRVDGPSMEPTLHDGQRLFVNKFIYRFKTPQRGDIIVFNPKGVSGTRFIKRIIGLPGETVEIHGGKVFVDSNALDEEYIKAPPQGTYGPYYVDEDEYFVLGDNRTNSSDSRFPYVGMVERSFIAGKAFWVYWPLNKIRILVTPKF